MDCGFASLDCFLSLYCWFARLRVQGFLGSACANFEVKVLGVLRFVLWELWEGLFLGFSEATDVGCIGPFWEVILVGIYEFRVEGLIIVRVNLG